NFQIQLAKRQGVVPMTRDYIGHEEAKLRGVERGQWPRLQIAGEEVRSPRSSSAGRNARRNKGKAMPVVQAARSLEPAPIDRKAPRGVRNEKLLPWPRSASTAIIFRRLRIAM